jgi:hypothetical protein
MDRDERRQFVKEPPLMHLRICVADHKYRWELHSYGLRDEYDKLVVADIIALLTEALKGIGTTNKRPRRAQPTLLGG